MNSGRDPAEVARWTLEHFACWGSARDPAAPAKLTTADMYQEALERIEREERDWFDPVVPKS